MSLLNHNQIAITCTLSIGQLHVGRVDQIGFTQRLLRFVNQLDFASPLTTADMCRIILLVKLSINSREFRGQCWKGISMICSNVTSNIEFWAQHAANGFLRAFFIGILRCDRNSGSEDGVLIFIHVFHRVAELLLLSAHRKSARIVMLTLLSVIGSYSSCRWVEFSATIFDAIEVLVKDSLIPSSDASSLLGATGCVIAQIHVSGDMETRQFVTRASSIVTRLIRQGSKQTELTPDIYILGIKILYKCSELSSRQNSSLNEIANSYRDSIMTRIFCCAPLRNGISFWTKPFPGRSKLLIAKLSLANQMYGGIDAARDEVTTFIQKCCECLFVAPCSIDQCISAAKAVHQIIYTLRQIQFVDTEGLLVTQRSILLTAMYQCRSPILVTTAVQLLATLADGYQGGLGSIRSGFDVLNCAAMEVMDRLCRCLDVIDDVVCSDNDVDLCLSHLSSFASGLLALVDAYFNNSRQVNSSDSETKAMLSHLCDLVTRLVGHLRGNNHLQIKSDAVAFFLPVLSAVYELYGLGNGCLDSVRNAQVWYALTKFMVVCENNWQKHKSVCRRIATNSPSLFTMDTSRDVFAELSVAFAGDSEVHPTDNVLRIFLCNFVPRISKSVVMALDSQSVRHLCAIVMLESFRASSHLPHVIKLFDYLDAEDTFIRSNGIDIVGDRIFEIWQDSVAERIKTDPNIRINVLQPPRHAIMNQISAMFNELLDKCTHRRLSVRNSAMRWASQCLHEWPWLRFSMQCVTRLFQAIQSLQFYSAHPNSEITYSVLVFAYQWICSGLDLHQRYMRHCLHAYLLSQRKPTKTGPANYHTQIATSIAWEMIASNRPSYHLANADNFDPSLDLERHRASSFVASTARNSIVEPGSCNNFPLVVRALAILEDTFDSQSPTAEQMENTLERILSTSRVELLKVLTNPVMKQEHDSISALIWRVVAVAYLGRAWSTFRKVYFQCFLSVLRLLVLLPAYLSSFDHSDQILVDVNASLEWIAVLSPDLWNDTTFIATEFIVFSCSGCRGRPLLSNALTNSLASISFSLKVDPWHYGCHFDFVEHVVFRVGQLSRDNLVQIKGSFCLDLARISFHLLELDSCVSVQPSSTLQRRRILRESCIILLFSIIERLDYGSNTDEPIPVSAYVSCLSSIEIDAERWRSEYDSEAFSSSEPSLFFNAVVQGYDREVTCSKVLYPKYTTTNHGVGLATDENYECIGGNKLSVESATLELLKLFFGISFLQDRSWNLLVENTEQTLLQAWKHFERQSLTICSKYGKWSSKADALLAVSAAISGCIMMRFLSSVKFSAPNALSQSQNLHKAIGAISKQCKHEVYEASVNLIPLLGSTVAVNLRVPFLHWGPAEAYLCVGYLNRANNLRASGLSVTLMPSEFVSVFALRSLTQTSNEELCTLLPQLIQLLRYDFTGGIGNLLLRRCSNSPQVSLMATYTLDVECLPLGTISGEGWGHNRLRHGIDPLPAMSQLLLEKLPNCLTDADAEFLERESSFFKSLTEISGLLFENNSKDKESQRALIRNSVSEIAKPSLLYLPTDPGQFVAEVVADSGSPMQSAAKRPYLLSFRTLKWPGPDSHATFDKANLDSRCDEYMTNSCIFKVHDDCRQDSIALQVVAALWVEFQAAQLPVFLAPYAVIPMRAKGNAMGGIIQCVRNVKSRDQMGKAGTTSLLQYFVAQYGPVHSNNFVSAQSAFVASAAGYAVACYLLAVKDRHNGNILLDSSGHLIHIDYGFLLGTSPGGNLGFETAAFKLTGEMIELMGGLDSKPFLAFEQAAIRAFLVARRHMHKLVTIVASFVDSGAPCYLRSANNVTDFRNRFFPELNDCDAALAFRSLIFDAAGKWTTRAYDWIQLMQNNIKY